MSLSVLTPALFFLAATSFSPIGADVANQTKNLSSDLDAFRRGTTNICQGCNLQNATFPPAPEDEPDFYHNSRLRSSDLQGATLSDRDLTGTYFTCADLRNANLSGANLTNTDFIYADLRGANLSGANLSNATFRGALMDATTDLTDTTISDKTIAPNSQFAVRNSGGMTEVTPITFDNRRNCPGREP